MDAVNVFDAYFSDPLISVAEIDPFVFEFWLAGYTVGEVLFYFSLHKRHRHVLLPIHQLLK